MSILVKIVARLLLLHISAYGQLSSQPRRPHSPTQLARNDGYFSDNIAKIAPTPFPPQSYSAYSMSFAIYIDFVEKPTAAPSFLVPFVSSFSYSLLLSSYGHGDLPETPTPFPTASLDASYSSYSFEEPSSAPTHAATSYSYIDFVEKYPG